VILSGNRCGLRGSTVVNTALNTHRTEEVYLRRFAVSEAVGGGAAFLLS